MKRLITSAAAIIIFSGTALAQTPNEKPAEPQPAGITLNTGNEGKHARETDARHCLDLKDSNAVIRCAERYRSRARAPLIGY